MDIDATKQELQDLVKRYIASVETADRALFDTVWAKEGTCRIISGTNVFAGRDLIYDDFVVGAIGAAYTSIRLVPHDIQAFPERDDLAIILFSYHTECTLRESGEPFGISGMETQVAVKEDEGWRLLHVHYSIAS